ncbi:MAG: hypothetical protein QXE66_03290 [Desulfurococcaceae archaeon]
MEYEVEERSSIDDRRYDLKDFAKKLRATDLRLSSILSLPVDLRKLVNEDNPRLEFHSPVKSKLLLYTYLNEKIIVHDYKSFEVTGVGVDFKNLIHLEPMLVIKTHDEATVGIHLYFSELIAFLFYSGAYEKIRRGEYDGSTELAEVIMDVAELVYDAPNALQLCNNLPFESEKPFHTVTYIIRWEPESWMKGYAGIVIDSSGVEYSLLILNESMRVMFEVGIASSRRGYGKLSSLSLSTANSLPLVKAMVDSFDEIRNDLEKYIDSLRLAHVATKTYKVLTGV